MRLGVIPARGGSKRIPRKNIKLFGGKPMIAWSIQAALKSGCFDRLLVSTDDCEIAEIASDYGAEVPFMRPTKLSNDYVGTIPVIAHATKWVSENGAPASLVCCIYATAPFLNANDLKRGLTLIQNSGAEFAFSVTSYAFAIQRAIRITSDQRVEMFEPDKYNSRSQDLECAWHDAGQFYWGLASSWLEQKPLFANYSVPVFLPRYRVQDIDTQEDWVRAEWMFKALTQEQ